MLKSFPNPQIQHLKFFLSHQCSSFGSQPLRLCCLAGDGQKICSSVRRGWKRLWVNQSKSGDIRPGLTVSNPNSLQPNANAQSTREWTISSSDLLQQLWATPDKEFPKVSFGTWKNLIFPEIWFCPILIQQFPCSFDKSKRTEWCLLHFLTKEWDPAVPPFSTEPQSLFKWEWSMSWLEGSGAQDQ